MTKRLLNLNKSTRIITILLTTLLFLPSIARAEETITYDLTIGGIEVTSDNATDVLGDGKVSFDPETNTLTLNNAILSDDIICNITSLFIDIIGSNSITTNGKPAISTTLEAASPKISIKSTSNPIGSLVLRNTSQETPCGGVVKGNISINAEAPISILLPTSSNFLTMDTAHVAAFGKSYDLMVGSEAVTNINASDILGDGKATYDPDKNTLSLNGVTTSMIYCKAPQPLTIEINGSNTVGMIVGYGGDENPLTIKKSGSSPASLDINPGDQVLDDMGPVFHFSSCTWGDGLYLVAYSNNTTISGAYYDESGRQFKHSTYSSINRVIISTPSIWVGGAKVLEDGTFSNNSGIFFDKETNTLTLSSSPSGNITSSLQNLKINIDGNDLCMYTNKIISVNSTASLSFEGSSNKSSLSFTIDNARTNNILPWEGFTGNPTFEDKLVYLPNDGSQFIKVLEAPTILYSEGSLKFSGLSDTYGNYFNCHYTITYGDGTTETGQNSEMGESLSVSKPQLTPCTVTAYAEFDQFGQTTRSDNAIAYYLEFAEDMKVTFDGTEREILKSDYPALIPDVEDIEFILSNSTNQNAICQETINNESHIKIKGFGATDLILYNSNPGFTVLNSGGGAVALSATVVPSAPTFSVESGTYNEAQTLTLASPYQKTNGDDQTVINIKYYTDGNSNNPVTYTGPISINQSTTITAWVEASVTLPTGAQETYSSDEISQEYVIKEEAFIDFMQEENGEYSPIGANQVITGTYGHTIPKVVMPYVSDLQGTITFSSSDETVVASSSISLDEEYTLKYTVSGAGNTTIQAKYTPGADEPFLSTTRNFNLKIEPRDISNATISMGTNGESSFVYNGAAIEPITSVSLAASGTAIAATLNAETDFDSNYYLVSGETETALDGAPTNVGSYKVTVSAKGNYTGSKSATFTIIQTTITPTVDITGWTYGATANTPSVSGNTGEGSVTYEYKLQNAEDSKYSTEVPTEAGNYTIKATIAATVNYEAAVDSTHFTISKANITPTVTLEGWAYGATANTPSVSGNTGEGSVTYEYKLKTAEDSEYKADVPTEAGDYTIKATIAATANFEGATTTTDFTITKTSITPTVTLEGWTYGTTAKTPTISGNTGNGSVTYEYKLKTAEDSEYKADAPTEAGEYTIKATIAATANYEAATATTDFTISKANITPTVTLEGWTYGATANTPTITGNTGNGEVTYTYQAEGAETFTETMPEVVGTHTIKASIAETTNYNAGEATATFTITAATMTVSAAGHEGTYDNKAHGITVTAPEGSKVMYGSQNGTYNLTEAPTYTDAGTYEVYYQVTMNNYTTVTGSETVNISKAAITPTVTLEGWTYGTTAKTPSITGNTGEGTVTYSYKAEGTESFVETKPLVVGTHTVKASIAETTNYNAGEATTTFTITAATMTITAAGHEGTYDGKAHGITVTAPENATIKYGEQEGSYEQSEAPTYTDAGTYEVYYQVTMDNYTTVTGSATVEISKADITPTVTLEGWTYGATANTPTITGNTGNGTVTYTYKAEGAETFVETAPETAGNYTIKASIAETTNYNAGEATATFTITAATMTVTAKGYEGTYDGKAHGITVTAPENATIKYGTAEGTYELNASPEYTTAGNYTVYYQVTMDNYATVTGSETVKISKAEAELEFDVPEESKVYATIGKEFTEPTLNNLKGLDVTFSSSDESVATVDKNTGKVTLKSAGLTYITATFAGNDNYNEFAVKYELRVKGSYNLWIDNVQVTSDNYNDILENQKFFYDLVNKWLIITNNETPVTVKSSMPELTIYLNGKSELERIYFDNQGNAQNTGTLSFFNYNDVPGKLTLDTNNDNGVISGFSSISFDDNTKLRFIDPDSCEYKDGLVKMTKPSQLGEIVKQVTIGQYIEPMANGDGISFGNIDSETNITNMTIEEKLLITATQHEEGSNEDDDYIDPNNGAFVMNTTNTSEDVEVLSQGVESGNKQPGSEDYADSFRGGITFMIPSGTGTIELELMNEEGYMLMLKIGTGVPHEIVRYERATVVIDYNVDEPTYVYLYLEEKSIIGARRAGNNTRVGKRDKAHGTVFSVKVKAASVSSTNPLNNVEGATGNITIPDVNTTTPSGDDVPTKAEFKITNDENKANDDKWYTIDGQRINKPTQKGVYIRNRKKVVVK